MGQTLLHRLNLTYAEVAANWSRYMRSVKSPKFRPILTGYLRKLMRGVRVRTSPRVSYHKAFDWFTLMPKMTLIRHITDDDFREVNEWEEWAATKDQLSSEYIERRRAFSAEKLKFNVERGLVKTTQPIIATQTLIDSFYSTCYHLAWWNWDISPDAI